MGKFSYFQSSLIRPAPLPRAHRHRSNSCDGNEREKRCTDNHRLPFACRVRRRTRFQAPRCACGAFLHRRGPALRNRICSGYRRLDATLRSRGGHPRTVVDAFSFRNDQRADHPGAREQPDTGSRKGDPPGGTGKLARPVRIALSGRGCGVSRPHRQKISGASIGSSQDDQSL